MSNYPLFNLDPFRLAVFDLDDTLYSAEHNLKEAILFDCLVAAAKKQGIPVDEEDIVGSLFTHDEHGRDELSRQFAAGNFDMDVLVEHFKELDISMLKPCEYTIKLLEAMPLKRVIVTDSPDLHSERVLERLAKKHLFEEVCSSTSRGFVFKPHASVFTNCLERHKVQAKESFIVEDSILNIKGAKQQGMSTVLVGPKWQDYCPEADAAYPDVLTFLEHCRFENKPL